MPDDPPFRAAQRPDPARFQGARGGAVYLDHAATTPLLPAARIAMDEGFAAWANPSSPHAAGRRARALLEDARGRIAAALGCDGAVILTGGASEALAIGLGRAKVERRIVSAVEHDAVLRAAPGAEVLPVIDGVPDPAALELALAQPGRAIVAVQAVNSETGTILMPLADDPVPRAVRKAGGLLLVDAAQAAGKLALPEADMIVISAHKFGGPVGVGALLVRDLALLEPTGGQERGYRGGTENLPGALGMAAALEAGGIAGWATTAEQRLTFRNALMRHGEVLALGEQCTHILALASPRLAANPLLIRLDAKGFAVSAGSACSSGTLKPSRALAGFGVAPDLAARTIRVSLGWNTTPAELDAFVSAFAELAA